MRNALHNNTENKATIDSKKDMDSQRRKRNRITKRAEVTVHQWTFSTEVK